MTSWPVLAIGRADQIVERVYREDCAARLCEVLIDLENYLGTGRIYIP